MDMVTHRLADLILEIEAEMRRIGLWENSRPEEAALASLVPFCHDTLSFQQWLQWVFLPKMKAVVETGDDFPARSDIHPLAEHSLEHLLQKTDGLLALIRQFDEFINTTL